MDAEIVRRNLRLIIGITCLTSPLVLLPVYVVFFQTRGLSTTTIAITQAVFGIILAVAEVPGGWFADRFGYKKSLLVGASILTVAYGAYIPDFGLASILIAEVMCGIGVSFISGANTSLAHMSLAAINQQGEHSKRYGQKLQIWFNLTGIIFSVAGGMLVLISIYAVLIVQTATMVIAIFLARKLQEPPRLEQYVPLSPPRATTFKGALREMKKALVYALHGHAMIKWLIIFSAFMSTVLTISFWLTQPYLQAVQLPIWLFGIVNSIFMGMAIVFALLTEKYKLLGWKLILAGFVLISAGCYLILAIGPALGLIPVFAGFYFVRSICHPIIEARIHDEITDNDIRASVLSVEGLVAQLVFMLIFIVAGLITDNFSLRTTLLSIGIAWAVLGTALIVRMARLGLLAPRTPLLKTDR